jgi:hypothetical protein
VTLHLQAILIDVGAVIFAANLAALLLFVLAGWRNRNGGEV